MKRVAIQKYTEPNPDFEYTIVTGSDPYGYDQLYRLLQYDRGQFVSGTITNPTLTQDWTLDQTGNWNNFQQGVIDALNQNRTHNTTNEITAIAKTVGDVWPTPAYDANGNMTEFPQPDDLTSTFDATWDADTRIDFESQKTPQHP